MHPAAAQLSVERVEDFAVELALKLDELGVFLFEGSLKNFRLEVYFPVKGQFNFVQIAK